MEKIDLTHDLKQLYSASARSIVVVDVPSLQFLMVDGYGDPNTTPVFQQHVDALYSLSYTLKFMLKKKPDGTDFKVMPLEGLWWMDDLDHKDDWKWTLMILQPDFITAGHLEEACGQLRKKKDLPSLDSIRLQRLEEGKAVQILHIGPYSDEGPKIEQLHSYMTGHGFRSNGKHHEIYLSDPRRVPPEKWKTILRQPVK